LREKEVKIEKLVYFISVQKQRITELEKEIIKIPQSMVFLVKINFFRNLSRINLPFLTLILSLIRIQTFQKAKRGHTR